MVLIYASNVGELFCAVLLLRFLWSQDETRYDVWSSGMMKKLRLSEVSHHHDKNRLDCDLSRLVSIWRNERRMDAAPLTNV